jgi:hypothetical protein
MSHAVGEPLAAPLAGGRVALVVTWLPRVVVVLLCGLIASWLLVGRSGGGQTPPLPAMRVVGGPLAPDGLDSSGAWLPSDVGRGVASGNLPLVNAGSATATIERVTLLHRDPSLHLIGAVTVPWGTSSVGIVHGFPLARDSVLLRAAPRPAAGTRVEPGGLKHAQTLILGFSVSRLGIHSFRGVRIDYRVGDQPYRTVYPFAATVCAPKLRFLRKECPAPALV